MENRKQAMHTPEHVKEWFNKGEWKMGWAAMPDASINPTELYNQVHLNPERWAQAFRFLATTDLAALPKGRHELDGTNLYASVDEYLSREPEDCRLEAHRKYADIQYVISGQEQIGITPLAETVEATPYHPRQRHPLPRRRSRPLWPGHARTLLCLLPQRRPHALPEIGRKVECQKGGGEGKDWVSRKALQRVKNKKSVQLVKQHVI